MRKFFFTLGILLVAFQLNAQISFEKQNISEPLPSTEPTYVSKLSNYSKIIFNRVKNQQDAESVAKIHTNWSKTFIKIEGIWHIHFIAKATSAFENNVLGLGIHLGIKNTPFYTGLIPFENVADLLQLESVLYVEFGIPVTPTLSAARNDTDVDDVHAGASKYKGSKKEKASLSAQSM